MALTSFKEWQIATKLNSILLEADRQGITVRNLWQHHVLPVLEFASTDNVDWLLSEVENQLNSDDVSKNVMRLVNLGAKQNVPYPYGEIAKRLGKDFRSGNEIINNMVKGGYARVDRNPDGELSLVLTKSPQTLPVAKSVLPVAKPVGSPNNNNNNTLPVAKPVGSPNEKKVAEITKEVIEPLRKQFEMMMKNFLNAANHNNFTNDPKLAPYAHQIIKRLHDKVMPVATAALSPTWRKAEKGEYQNYQNQYSQARTQHNADFSAR